MWAARGRRVERSRNHPSPSQEGDVLSKAWVLGPTGGEPADPAVQQSVTAHPNHAPFSPFSKQCSNYKLTSTMVCFQDCELT